MRTRSLLCFAAALGLLLMGRPAHATNFSGKIRLVQVNSTGLRFLADTGGLSFYATGDAKDVLLHAFYAQAGVDVIYTVTSCPGGLLGTCGTVSSVTVDRTDLP